MPWHPCVNSRDMITQDDGIVLPNFHTLGDDKHTVTSHCRDADGTWITWFDDTTDGTDDGVSPGFNDISTYTGNDFPVHVGYFPDDGSPATVYDLAINYIWDWKATGRYSAVSTCFIHNIAGGLYFGNNIICELAGWNTAVQDVQVRTDGTNVWVVVLARESVMYPWLSDASRVDRCGIAHSSIHADAIGEGLTPGEDADALDHSTVSSPGGGTWWQQSSPENTTNDDAGLSASFRWQPARVTVYGGDLGGFTRLGTVEADFLNDGDNLDNSIENGLTGGVGLSSGIETAASQAEPGKLHVLWAEAGAHQEFFTEIGQRLTYSQWDSDSKISQTDLVFSTETATANGFSSTLNWVWTAEMIVRNDHGSPAVIVLPWTIETNDPILGVEGAPGPPQYWDLSSGAAVVVQEMDESLYPTNTESGITGPTAPVGVMRDDFPHRSNFASSLYTDPTLDNIDVYLLSIGFSGDPTDGSGTGSRQATAFYRIPADGSDTFDYMDGTRLAMYSILPRDFSTELMQLAAADFVSDPGNVWVPTQATDAKVLHLPRTCTRTWELLEAFPVSAGWVDVGSFVVAATSPPAIVTDDSGDDWLVAGGISPVISLTSDPLIVSALWGRICRCCTPCIERIGLHIWEKV